MTKQRKSVLPEKFSVDVFLPSYVIKELKDIAALHDATLEEEIARAILLYHAKSMADMIKGELE